MEGNENIMERLKNAIYTFNALVTLLIFVWYSLILNVMVWEFTLVVFGILYGDKVINWVVCLSLLYAQDR